MNILIRKAVEAELPVLLTFEKGIVAAERPYDSSLKAGEIHYYDLLELMKSGDAELLVAQINDEIVGSGYAKILSGEPYQSFERYAYLGFMYVKPAYRGLGINNLIIENLKSWAKTKNLSEIRLEVYNGNEPAIKAYQKAGFEANLLKMRLKI
jgi:ribosomal protein S18 acetylase RimI-like enzyme